MKSILLGEDDRNFGQVLKQELEEDFTVVLVPDGLEAVLNFISAPYDFVLLDILMPKLNGMDALKIIKKINPRIPVITFSGKAGEEDMEQAVKDGAVQCLRKPFKVAKLKELMRNQLK